MTDLQRLRQGATGVGGTARPPVRTALGLFGALVVVLTAVVGVSQPHPFVARDIPYLTGPGWLDGWFWLDSGWYWAIATGGYAYVPGQQSTIAFFPTYPLVVRGVAAAVGDVQIAGTVVTVLAGAAAAGLFAIWTSRWLPAVSARTAVVLLLLYPYTFFIVGTMYADALFLLTVIGAFVLLERGHPWLAGLVGALATAGRPVGMAVAVGLVVRLLEIRAQAPREGEPGHVTLPQLAGAVRRVRPRDLGVLVSVLGFGAWCTYLWLSFGDPLAFVAAEASPGWDQGSGPRTWFKAAFVGQLLHGRPEVAATLAVQALFCLAALLLLRRVWRRFGWGYLAYTVVVLAIPLIGTKDFMGTGRYLLAAFPVMAVAGDALASSRHVRWLRPLVFALFAAGLLFGMSLYARGYEVS